MFPLQQNFEDQNIFMNNSSRYSWGSQLSPVSTDPSQAQENWLSTSLDSTTSFGQSPVFDTRHLLVTPSTSTGLVPTTAGDEDDQGQKM